ncbi:MAG: penicillin-binding protein 1B [Gammaproteobacteria bacterium]|jgi:penicillin-binding protein 1B
MATLPGKSKHRSTTRAGGRNRRSGSPRRVRVTQTKKARISGRGWLMRGGLLALVVAAGYGAWLDFTVRARFEGSTWALPARIYARPLELYPGLAIDRSGLTAELVAAGYHQVSNVRRSGSFARNGAVFDIATRGFQFWDGAETPHRLRLAIVDGQIRSLAEHARPLALARLDPALIGRVYPGHKEDRELVRLEEVPDVVVNALVALEDRDFFEHWGLSFRGIARAMWANVRAGAAVQGGSTLTQQLAKNLYLNPERKLRRKINEALMAVVLEMRYEKSAILEAYLNEVYLGQDGNRAIHGFGLASWFYFGRRLDELNVHEAALLVGMVRGASIYNPRRQPKRALKRRNLVLDVMETRGVISAKVSARAKAAPLGVTKRAPHGASPHPAFVDLVRNQLARDYHSADLRTEGLQIFTTLEPVAQIQAEKALTKRLANLEKRGISPTGTLQGAVVLVRPASGEVVALVGDRQPRARGFNRAIHALRPIGSLVKPAVYLSALSGSNHHHLMSTLVDAPLTIRTPGQPPWQPQNYNKKFAGKIALIDALSRSNNLATVRLGLELGLGSVTRTLRKLGVERNIREVPSMLLGSVELTPLEVAQVYQTLANGGYRAPLRSIREVTDAEGRPLSRYGLQVARAADADGVYLLRHALERAMSEGTGRAVGGKLSHSFGFAGKTGTTDELRDSWFAGFNESLLGVVWVGRDDNKPAQLTGSSGALRIWGDLVPGLLDAAPIPSAVPRGIVWHWVSPGGESLTDAQCPGATRVPFRVDATPQYRPCESLSADSQRRADETAPSIPIIEDAG